MIDLQNFLETVLFTGYIQDEDPVSILIVAKPERGKTSLLSRYITNKGVVYFTEVTAWGITDAILPEIERGNNIHHIIIPDFLNCVVKQKSSADKLIMFLNALTEEGISNIATYANRGIQRKTNENTKNSIIKCGIITAITDIEYQKRKKRWEGLGFVSRFLPIQYEYSSEYVNTIFDNISNEIRFDRENKLLNLPKEKQKVILSVKISKQIEPICKLIGLQIGSHGIRLFEIFRTILKANALRNNRNEVNQTDYDDLMKYIEFIKYNNEKVTTISK